MFSLGGILDSRKDLKLFKRCAVVPCSEVDRFDSIDDAPNTM